VGNRRDRDTAGGTLGALGGVTNAQQQNILGNLAPALAASQGGQSGPELALGVRAERRGRGDGGRMTPGLVGCEAVAVRLSEN